jgi:thiamine-phosphate pyrophosphorylase
VSSGPSERATSPIVVLVTDPRYERAHTEAVVREAAALLGGARVLVQLRDQQATPESLLAQARALRLVTRAVGARLVVNGSLAIARESAADGVHLPGRHTGADLTSACAGVREALGPHALVTVAAHDDDDVQNAARAGASAALVSPIFDVPDKGAPRGVAALISARAIADAARHEPTLAVVALGGVSGANAAACIDCGADGVAAIRALYEDGGKLLRVLAALGPTERSAWRPGP